MSWFCRWVLLFIFLAVLQRALANAPTSTLSHNQTLCTAHGWAERGCRQQATGLDFTVTRKPHDRTRCKRCVVVWMWHRANTCHPRMCPSQNQMELLFLLQTRSSHVWRTAATCSMPATGCAVQKDEKTITIHARDGFRACSFVTSIFFFAKTQNMSQHPMCRCSTRVHHRRTTSLPMSLFSAVQVDLCDCSRWRFWKWWSTAVPR